MPLVWYLNYVTEEWQQYFINMNKYLTQIYPGQLDRGWENILQLTGWRGSVSSEDILRTTLLDIYPSHDFYFGSIIILHICASAALDVAYNEKRYFWHLS